MKADNYERIIEAMMTNATLLDHYISPCQESFIPDDVTVSQDNETPLSSDFFD